MAIANITAAWVKVTHGQIISGVLGVYTDLLGPWFWVMLFFIPTLMFYLKTKNFGSTVVIGLVVSPTLIPLFPSVIHYTIFVFVAAGITGVMYRVFHD